MADAKDPKKTADTVQGQSEKVKSEKAKSGQATSGQTTSSQAKSKPLTIDLPAKDVKEVKAEGPSDQDKAPDKASDKTSDKAAPSSSAKTDPSSEKAKPEASQKTPADPAEKKPSQPASSTADPQKAKPAEGSKTKPAATTPRTSTPNLGKSDPKRAGSTTTSARKDSAPVSETRQRAGGSSFGSLLIAALIGGGLTLGGNYALQQQGFLSATGSQASLPQDLETRLAALEGRPAGVTPADISGLSASLESALPKLDALEARVAEMDPAARLDALETRVAAASADLDAITSAVSSGGAGPDAALETLSSSIEEQSKALDSLTVRLDALSVTQTDAPDNTEALAAVNQQIATLAADLSQLASDLQARASSDDVTALDERLTAVAAASSSAEIAALVRRMNGLAGLALVSRLQNDMAHGKALSDLLALSKSYLTEEEATVLASGAADGFATSKALSDAFAPVRKSIEAQLNRADPDAGLVDKLLANAGSLVTVRPAGTPDGTSPEEVLSRIAGHLDAGDIEAAEASWADLPSDIRDKNPDFGARLSDVARARSALNTAHTRAIQALSVSNAE
ncbi:hypothetical protein [Coralliovum pocilloporae]|uniref:hypothetical protein n=1 Tax=Coralliovum pocilloporae TaxID=3066369 RepID=UPI0033073F38